MCHGRKTAPATRPPHIGGQALPELHPPLVERVDVPHEALHRRPVLVQRQHLAEVVSVHLGEANRGARNTVDPSENVPILRADDATKL